MQNNNTTDNPTRGARVGRAVAWFAAGALGATTLTGVALAATDDTDTTPPGPPAAAGQFQGGPGGPDGQHGKRGGMHARDGAMVHSEGVIKTPDGEFQNMTSQRGEVTEVGDNSVTILSDDGFTATYQVNDDTRVSKDREQKSLGDIKTGDKVRVMAEKDGDKLTAKHVGAMSEEMAAEMEQKREEMQQKRQEMREQRQQDGDATQSGFGGPPSFTSEAL